MPTHEQAGPKLLLGPQALVAIREMVKDETNLDLAVAYWGQGAVEALGLLQRKDATRILCDLYSLQCAPLDLAKLARRRKVEVRSVKELHAKFYLNGNRLVMGSSNASAQGLGFSGGSAAEQARRVELNLATSDAATLKAAGEWFEAQWQDTTPLKPAEIEALAGAWEKRRKRERQLEKQLQAPLGPTLLGALDRDPRLAGTAIRVLAYGDPATDRDDDFVAINREANEKDDLPEDLDHENSYYADNNGWTVEPGKWLMDFERVGPGLKHVGIWRVRETGPLEVPGPGNWLLFRVRKVRQILGYAVPKEELERIRDAVTAYCEGKSWEVDKFKSMADLPLDELMKNYG